MEKTFHTGAAECEARERRRYDSAGIARDYVNAAGKRESISDASRQKLYEAMSQERLDGDALSPVYVFRQRESYSVTINSLASISGASGLRTMQTVRPTATGAMKENFSHQA